MIIFPLIAVFAGAVTIILEKTILSKQKVDYRLFVVTLFLLLFLVSTFFAIFWGKISPSALNTNYLWLLIGMVVVACGWNILLYRGLQQEEVVEFELINLLRPIAIIFIAGIFLAAERNLHTFLAAAIASGALLVSHIRRHHLVFDRYSIGLLGFVLLAAVEAIFDRQLLEVYSPSALYAVRTGLVFLSLWLVFRPNFRRLTSQNILSIFILAVIATSYMIFMFSGFKDFGVVFTTLVLTLTPILIYFFAVVFLKEKLRKRVVLAAAIILACIIYATLAVTK